jgi:hypothetical protein
MATPPAAPLATRHLDRVRVALVICVATLAGLVAIIAYLVSFEAISAYVATIGAMPHWLRWCGPLLIDTFITIATAFLLWLALSGAKLRSEFDVWFAWLLIATATLASAYLNAAHAPDRWDARLVAGAVPVALLASVHLLVRLMVRLLTLHVASATTTTTTTTTTAVATDPAPPERRANGSASATQTAPLARAISPRQSRRAIGATRPVYERLVATGQPVTWRQFAAAFEPPMPRRTAQRHLAHHQASVNEPGANGQRPLADLEEASA